MSGNGNGRLRFGDYELDREAGKLLRQGWPVKLEPQPFRVLALLLERPGEIFSRDEIRARIWGDTPFVEFDQGLYYCIRQIRLALRDKASKPGYIETLPKQGYRFVANIATTPNGVTTHLMEPEPTIPTAAPSPPPRRRSFRPLIAAVCVFAGITIGVIFWRRPHRPAQLQYTQLTDFNDSAVAPALSRDGRMLAFIRGDSSWAADQIYVKMLPNGEPRRLTSSAGACAGRIPASTLAVKDIEKSWLCRFESRINPRRRFR